RVVEQEIEMIEQAPGLDESEKEALIDALVESTNATLISQNAEAGAALAGQVAAHVAYATALPWHLSKADPAPHTSTGNGTQRMGGGWKREPPLGTDGAGPGGNGSVPGTGGSHVSGQVPGQATDAPPGANGLPHGQIPGQGTDGVPNAKHPGHQK